MYFIFESITMIITDYYAQIYGHLQVVPGGHLQVAPVLRVCSIPFTGYAPLIFHKYIEQRINLSMIKIQQSKLSFV